MDKNILSPNKILVNGKKVGTVSDETFYKEIRGSKHIMRTPHAIFFDIASLQVAESYGAKFLHITDKETGEVYTATIADVWQYAIERDYGFNLQVGLAVNRFNVTHSGSDTSQAQEYHSPTEISFAEYYKRHPTKAEKQAGQMDLFGEVSK